MLIKDAGEDFERGLDVIVLGLTRLASPKQDLDPTHALGAFAGWRKGDADGAPYAPAGDASRSRSGGEITQRRAPARLDQSASAAIGRPRAFRARRQRTRSGRTSRSPCSPTASCSGSCATLANADSHMTMDAHVQLQQRVERQHSEAFDGLVRQARERLERGDP
jgi:hypothetical protein